MEQTFPLPQRPTLWIARRPDIPDTDTCHARTDGSFRKSAGLGWIITKDSIGARTLGARQTAFDAGVAAIEEAATWFGPSPYIDLIMHSDPRSAITRAGHAGAAPG
jgi:hypothetical protein